MELRQLRYFVVLGEEKHFGRAAARLQITTPTLSQQISSLERSLGQRLVDRSSHGVALNRSGAALLDQARLVLAAAERAHQAATGADAAAQALDVRVATGLIPVLRREFPALESHPGWRINLILTHGTDAELAVLHGLADAAFVWARSRCDPAIAGITVSTIPVCLAVPAGHRLARHERIPVSELRAETIALFPRRLAPGVYDALVRHLLPGCTREEQHLLDETVRLDPHEAMLRAVADGRAVAPLVEISAERLQASLLDDVVMRPLDPPLSLPMELIWREPPRPRLHELIEQLRPDD